MRSSILLPLITFLTTQGTSATCVDGHIETITPDYQVQYKCGQYRSGTAHKNIQSEHDCALLCKDSPHPVCSYSPSAKVCVVGKEDGKDIPKDGITYMTKFEDPFLEEEEKDPFEPNCEEEKQELEAELAQYKASAGSYGNASFRHGLDGNCNLRMQAKNEKGLSSAVQGLRNCQKACQQNPECKSWQVYTYAQSCVHYGKPVAELEKEEHVIHLLFDKDCNIG
ncbi:hypothetical protein FOVSG1_005039 [Fusarium oxysporum f. sp. vasinfectum]